MLSVILTVIALHAAGEPAAPVALAKGVMAAPAAVQGGIQGEPPYGLVLGRGMPRSEQVCFRDPIVGSKIPTRRCMSREMFVQRQQDSKDHTDSIQRDARAQTSF